MAMAWQSETGARDWVSDCQGVDAHRPLVLAQNDTQKGIKLKKTPIDDAEHDEGEADAQGTGVKKHTKPNTPERKGTGLPVEAGRGGEACR